MKNKTIIETIKNGVDKAAFDKVIEESPKDITSVASILTAALAIEPIFYSYDAPTLILGALMLGLNGMAVAGYPKEDLMKYVSEEYDKSLAKVQKYVTELEKDPDAETILTKKAKEVKMDDDIMAIMPTDGKVH